ncbi:MAG TPA: YibE/F family protein [Candidatus Binatia bacterium]|nr:YibE/F family protein [Candidatus Binatia bacterium]
MKGSGPRLSAVIIALASLAMAVLPFAASRASAASVNAPLTREEIVKKLGELNAGEDPASAPSDAEAQANEQKIEEADALPPDEYVRGRIASVASTVERETAGVKEHVTTYKVILLDGAEKGKEVEVQTSDLDAVVANRSFKAGDKIVIVKSYKLGGEAAYYLADSYRIPALAGIVFLFMLAGIAFGRWRGVTSLLGLAVTVGIIMLYVVPRITAGGDPLRVSLVATFAIAAVSLYLAHGFNRRTTIAFVSTLITLALSAWMAVSWVAWASLFGTGSEDAIFLQGSGFGDINLRGLLLGGIMLGVMGILDDITTAQAAIVEELKHANPSFKFPDLYKRGLSVGKEHISSLINTLFLAYAGASLPLFLLFTTTSSQPLWYVLNSETIAEEIVRTIVGSVCLILAVPITTAIAASYYGERRVRQGDAPPLPHHHH